MSSLKYTTGHTKLFINPQKIQTQSKAYNRKEIDVTSIISTLGWLGVVIFSVYPTQPFFEPKKPPQIDSEECDGNDDDDGDDNDNDNDNDDAKEKYIKSFHISISKLQGQDEQLDEELSAAVVEDNRAHNDADDESNFGLTRLAEVTQEQRQDERPDIFAVGGDTAELRYTIADEEDVAEKVCDGCDQEQKTEEICGSYFEEDETSQIDITYSNGIPEEEMDDLFSRLREFLPDPPSNHESEEDLAYNERNSDHQRSNIAEARAGRITGVYNAADPYGEGLFVEVPLTPENTPNRMANYSYNGEQEAYSPQSPGWHYVEYHIGDRCA